MAAVAATILAHRPCPAGALLCEGGPNCNHGTPKSPRSPKSPKSPGKTIARSDDGSYGEQMDTGPSLNYLTEGNGGHDLLEDGSERLDQEVIQELYRRVKKSKAHIDNYLSLLAFVLLTALYLAILYLQADSFKTFEVSTAHAPLLPDGLTGEGGFTFSSTSDIYDWINDTIIQEIWQDPDCGNGICELPEEFAAFGRFGCPSDCGNSANLSQIIITFALNFPTTDAMALSSWNLCLEEPTSFCWYEENVVFTQNLVSNTTILDIPDGNWTLTVNAPLGGVVGNVVYNSTYKWNSPDAISRGESLVNWGNCAKNESETDLGKCRQAAGNIVACAKDLCTLFDSPITTNVQTSGLFVDLVGLCNADFNALDAFLNMSCTETAEYLTANDTGGFQTVVCNGGSTSPPPSRRRLLEQSTIWNSAKHSQQADNIFSLAGSSSSSAERRSTLAELNTSPSQFTSILWNALGATDSQRIFNLQVATQRATYSWAGDSCMANIPIPVGAAPRLAAFFCTYFGGPTYVTGCLYNSSLTGLPLTTDAQIAAEMNRLHKRLNVTLQQENSFVDIFLLALQSVVLIDDATLATFSIRLHQLNVEVVNNEKQGCAYVANTLNWSVGQKHYTEVNVGDSVTWVWEDDEPHSLEVDDGLGEDAASGFQGMGTGRLIVSRNTVCTPDNTGLGNISVDPMPCVLEKSGTSFSQFSYTRYFSSVGNFSYVDGRNGDSTYGVVSVLEKNVVSASSIGSLATECAPGCTLGVLRNGLCDNACFNEACAYDGGDCACSPNDFGVSQCSCPDGQTRANDGSCCEAFGTGTDLQFRFSLYTFGPNVTETDANFLPKNGPPLFRYVAVHNRVLVGMAISQTRWRSRACKEGKFVSLFPNCTVGSSSKDYGVNPVFLPRSVLYNEAFAANDTSYYANYSISFDNSTLRNAQGIPYGFDPFDYNTKPTFMYFFDINYNNAQATESLQYLKDGFFVDNATKSMTVQLITYNGVARKFTLVNILLTFQEGGKVAASYDIQSINPEPYTTATDWARFVLEIIFVCCVFWNVLEEAKELWETKKREGSVLAHFRQLWNIIDFISLGIMLAGIGLWINFIFSQARPFKIRLRYRIYDLTALNAPGQYWSIVPPGDGFYEALKAFQRVEDMVFFRTYYLALQGINVLLMVLRILKLMDFQPRMGTITRTVAAAAPDLVHFFILFFVVFFGFAMYGHLVFGRTLDQFRTIAISLVTCFSAMLGNDSTNDYLMQLQGWELVAGVLFWWSFIIIMVFIIFNLLIAIVVEAFIKVREDMEEAPSMPSEVMWIIRHMGRRLFTPLRSDSELLRQLRALGADKAAEMAKEMEEWSRSHGKHTVEEPAQLVVKLEDRELDEKALEALLERAAASQSERKVKRIKHPVEPKAIADVIFHQYREETADEDYHRQTETEALLQNVENMKKDLEEMKSMVLSVVGTLNNLKAPGQRQ